MTLDELMGAIRSRSQTKSNREAKEAVGNSRGKAHSEPGTGKSATQERHHRDHWHGRPNDSDGGRGRPGRGGHGRHTHPSAEVIMEHFDKAHKGTLAESDVPEHLWRIISKADENHDSVISKSELETHLKQSLTDSTHEKSTPKNDEPHKEHPSAVEKTDAPKQDAQTPQEKKPADSDASTQHPE